MTQIESLPRPALERVTSSLVAWLATETRPTLGFEPMRAVVGALPAYQLTQTRWEWNGMGSDVEEDVLAAGTLEDVSSVVFRIVNRFNHGMRL